MNTVLELPKYAPDFEIPGIDQQVHHLTRYRRKNRLICVVFLGNTCPVSQVYIQSLQQLSQDLESEGVAVIGINSTDRAGGLASMYQSARSWQIQFPYLWDATQEVALGFKAQVTPQAFVVDQQGQICYSGRLDDQPENPDCSILRAAIANLLAGREVLEPVTQPTGTPIVWCS